MAAFGEPPSGKVTFLVTDIKNSSALSRRQWDTTFSKAVLKAPLETIREMSRSYRGCAFKDTGDGLLIVFNEPDAALKCAVSIQERFEHQGMEVTDAAGKSTKVSICIGIHSSTEDMRPQPSFDEWEGWDYKGKDVGFASRVVGVGDGSQIFVSDPAFRRLRAHSPMKWKWRLVYLKGFGFKKIWDCLWDGKSRGAPQQMQRNRLQLYAAVLLVLLFGLLWYRVQSRYEAHQRRLENVVAKGLRSMEAGDFSLAVLWFVEALRLEQGEPSREIVHRMRIGAVLREHPELVRTWFLEGGCWLEYRRNYAGFSPDGKRIVATGLGARVCEVATGKAVTPLMAHSNGLSSAVFSPDGRLLLTASQHRLDGIARVWNAETGHALTPAMKHPRNVMFFYAAFSPNGNVVATVGGDVAQLWDARTGDALTLPLEVGKADGRPRFSRDGKWLVTPNLIGSAQVWGVPSGRLVASVPHKAAEFVDFTPDGSRLVVGGFNSFRVWETGGWTPTTPEIQFGAIKDAAFSPDGKKLVIGATSIEILCDAEAPAVATAVLRFRGDISCTAFSPDSRLVAIASHDFLGNRGEVCVWEAQTGKPIINPIREEAIVNYLEFSNDKSQFLTVSSDRSSEREKTTNDEYIVPVRSRLRVWRLPRNDPEMVQAASTKASLLKAVKLSTNGATVITTEGNQVRIHDVSTGRLIATLQHRGAVTHTRFSRDGRKLATANEEGIPTRGAVRIWDSNSGKPISPMLLQDFIVGSLEFSSDGSHVLVACGDMHQRTGLARVWDIRTGQPLTPPMQLSGYLEFARYSPNGDLVVATGFNAARIWDAKTGLPVTPLLPHLNCFVTYAEFEPDGSHLLTTCVDPIEWRWDISSDFRPVARLIDLAQVLSGNKIDTAGAPIHLSREELQQASERLHQMR